MLTSDATPRPWGLMAGMPTNVLTEPGGLRVARCDFDGNFDSPEAHANARLIVRAVNAHDALIAACKAALPRLSEADNYATNLILDALKLAEAS